MGFYSELFCFYPAQNKSYFAGPTTSSSRYGYNFDTNQKIYLATIRQWFDWGSKNSGLTTYINTYLFAGGTIGATMSKAFLDPMQSIRGVINYDFIPYSSTGNKNTLISKLLFGDQNTEFNYLMIDQNLVADGNFDISTISTNLATMVYASSTDTSSITAAKTSQIYNSFTVNTFTDIKGNSIAYSSYSYNGVKYYLFYGDINIVRARRDETYVIELINELGFISSSSTIDNEVNTIIQSLTTSLITVNILICLICILIDLVVGIFSSRYLADLTLDKIIKLWVKIKLAQNAQAKMMRNQSRNQKVEFSQRFYDRSKNALYTNENEMDQLFLEVEDILKILNLKNFRLLEENDREYNKDAMHEYTQIVEMYKGAMERVKNDKDLADLKRSTQLYNIKGVLKRWYNNLGCIMYALNDYQKANSYFDQAVRLDEPNEESEMIENEDPQLK